MKFLRGLIVNLLLLLSLGELPAFAQPDSFRFSVRHKHWFKHCEGALRMDGSGIAYETPHRKHARVWSFRDLRHLEILSPTRLVINTYGNPAMFDFRLREAELTGDVYRFLAQHVERGLTSRVLFAATDFLDERPVKHRHRRGGCEGMLRIGLNEITYNTENVGDRRRWRMRDIRSFGTTGPYDLRLTTEKETFTFDLKVALSQQVYDHLWKTIHRP